MYCSSYTWFDMRLINRVLSPLLLAFLFVLWPHNSYAGTILVDGTNCTLPDAITAANTDTDVGDCTIVGPLGDDIIQLNTVTISLLDPIDTSFGPSGTPSITSTITITPQAGIATIQRTSDDQFRIFHVAENGSLTLNNIIVTNGDAGTYDGGGIYNEGNLTLNSSHILANTTGDVGGGIYNTSGATAHITGSTFSSNHANEGAAIANMIESTLYMTSTEMISNYASDDTGGLYNFLGTATVVSSRFAYNEAEDDAGIGNVGGTLYLFHSDVVSNTASDIGGGIGNSEGATAHIFSSTVSYNQSDRFGGGIANSEYGTLFLYDTKVMSNSVNWIGGGLHNWDVSIAHITGSTFLGNHSFNDGGGIGNASNSAITVEASHLLSNLASKDGGAIFIADGTVTITNSHLIDNIAEGNGGALMQAYGDSTTIYQSCIVNNSDTAVQHVEGEPINAQYNWWGAVDGPSGIGPGHGDSVSENVDFANFHTTAILDCSPSVTFSKQVTPSTNLLPGQPLTFTLTITNEGDFPLSDIQVTDPLPQDFVHTNTSFSGSLIEESGSYVVTELLPGEVATIHFLGHVDPTLNSDTTITNSATVSNVLIGSLAAQAVATVDVPVVSWSQSNYTANEDAGSFDATLILDKPNPYAPVKAQVVYTEQAAIAVAAVLDVEIPANTTSHSVAIPVEDDDQVAPRVIVLNLLSTEGAAAGSPSQATIALIEDDAQADLVVSKQASTLTAVVGDIITYTYIITNTGNVTFTTISAVDDVIGPLPQLEGELPPGASRPATAAYVVQPDDLPGPLVNTVIVTGTDVFGTEVEASAAATVVIIEPTNLPPGGQPQQGAELYMPMLGR
jgi:uncharacterized repeat protein (TIGR01451 family)